MAEHTLTVKLDASDIQDILSGMEARMVKMRMALETIERWELPESGRAWDDGRPMSYGAAFGSNGERDYMRSVARSALS